MGKRPMSDFEDPRLKGQVNKEDFEAILQIAVLCVAKSSKGRPTIEVVFEELDKAYKNTLAQSVYISLSLSPTPFILLFYLDASFISNFNFILLINTSNLIISRELSTIGAHLEHPPRDPWISLLLDTTRCITCVGYIEDMMMMIMMLYIAYDIHNECKNVVCVIMFCSLSLLISLPHIL